ncbi:MAG TPA: AraC family transcriptional regulator [Candidatus Sulfotelmatobacter sp.]|nr:AraC family transcriptional regulator [Candidatus Sulfotelmatobacter sp.]
MNTLNNTRFGTRVPLAVDPNPEKLVTRPKYVTIPDFGVAVLKSRHAPGFLGEMTDDFSKFHLIVAGHARWEGNGRSYVVGPGTLFHVPAGIPHIHTDLPHDPVTLYVIHYKSGLLNYELTEQISSLGMFSVDLGRSQINQASEVRSLYRRMLFEQDAQHRGWESLLQSCLIDLTVRSLRMASPKVAAFSTVFQASGDSVERVGLYALGLRQSFYHQQTLAEAAKSVSLSPRRFTALFRDITGQPWAKYVQSLRLEYAAKLLIETQKPIIAVAFESGFEDLSHFHHVFKATYQVSPLKFRRQNQQRFPHTFENEFANRANCI